MGSYLSIVAVRFGTLTGFMWIMVSATVFSHTANAAMREGVVLGLIVGLIAAAISAPASVKTAIKADNAEESLHDVMARFGLNLDRRANTVMAFRSSEPGIRARRVVARVDRGGNISLVGPRKVVLQLADAIAA
jgi:hypothetical protein